ncbi:MAG: hypothetical protein K1X28_03175 [Parachlamydiales bacterium]|nr:hypothetical protein [Parachlamydiales bacterium]
MEEIIQELQKIMKELKGLMSSKGGDLSNALDSLLSELNQTEKKFNGTKKDLLSQLKGIQNAISKVMDAVAQASDPKQGTLLLELSNLLKGQIEKDESQLEDSSKSFSNTCNELKDIMQKLIHSDSPCAANLYLVESLLSQFATPENSC